MAPATRGTGDTNSLGARRDQQQEKDLGQVHPVPRADHEARTDKVDHDQGDDDAVQKHRVPERVRIGRKKAAGIAREGKGVDGE